MRETTTIALCGKGGVGKTTAAALMVKALAERGEKRVLAIDADQADGLIQMAMVRTAMGQPQIAVDLLDRVLARQPENIRALEVRGRIALRLGECDRPVGKGKSHGRKQRPDFRTADRRGQGATPNRTLILLD